MAIHLITRSAIEGGGKQSYLEAVADDFRPIAEARGQRLLVLGSTIGSTARWPETTEIWEVEGFTKLGPTVEAMYTDETTDSALAAFWRRSFQYRNRGESLIVVGAAFSPSLDEHLQQGLEAKVFGVEEIRFVPGRRREALQALAERAALDHTRGRRLLLGGEVAFTNQRLVAAWAYADLASCNQYQHALPIDADLQTWRSAWQDTLESSFEYWIYATRATPLWPRAERDGAAIW